MLQLDLSEDKVKEDAAVEATFTYSVQWRETDTPYEKRMDKYRRYQFLPQHLEVIPELKTKLGAWTGSWQIVYTLKNGTVGGIRLGTLSYTLKNSTVGSTGWEHCQKLLAFCLLSRCTGTAC